MEVREHLFIALSFSDDTANAYIHWTMLVIHISLIVLYAHQTENTSLQNIVFMFTNFLEEYFLLHPYCLILIESILMLSPSPNSISSPLQTLRHLTCLCATQETLDSISVLSSHTLPPHLWEEAPEMWYNLCRGVQRGTPLFGSADLSSV